LGGRKNGNVFNPEDKEYREREGPKDAKKREGRKKHVQVPACKIGERTTQRTQENGMWGGEVLVRRRDGREKDINESPLSKEEIGPETKTRESRKRRPGEADATGATIFGFHKKTRGKKEEAQKRIGVAIEKTACRKKEKGGRGASRVQLVTQRAQAQRKEEDKRKKEQEGINRCQRKTSEETSMKLFQEKHGG